VQSYLASPAFRLRVEQLRNLGDGAGAGGCEGCAAEGILISAGGARLLTNVLVLLRVRAARWGTVAATPGGGG
jgi:hypothetical protein